MAQPRNPEVAGAGRRDFVVVPHRPGPLISLGERRSQRGRDDLDEIIDDFLPEVEERPGWFDAALPPVLTIDSGDRVTIESISGGPKNLPGEGFTVPPELLSDTDLLLPWFEASHRYALTLKPKPTKRQVRAV